MKIDICREYTETPGGRFRVNGEFSGEDFREELLVPRYLEAKEKNEKLIVNLDGSYGYPTSFLEESFGGLVRTICDTDVIERIVIISNDQPGLVDNIKKYMSEALLEGN